MRRKLLQLVPLLAACAGCGELVRAPAMSPPPGTYEVHFGVVRIGETPTRELVIRNTGGADLRVTPPTGDGGPFPVEPGCSSGVACEDRLVQPGGSLRFELSFRPISSGSFERTVEIATGLGTLEVHLDGEADSPRIECETPAGVGRELDFGRLVRGTTSTLPITCRNVSALDDVVLRVLEISGPNADSFSVFSLASADRRLLVQAGRSVDIPITFKALGTALLQNFAQLNLQVEKDRFLAPILLTGYVLEHSFEIEPLPRMVDETSYGAYDFGFVKPGRSRTIEITLRNLGNVPLEVQDFSLDPTSAASFTLEPPAPFAIPAYDPAHPGANEVHAVLRFGPTFVGAVSGQLNIVSADPAAPVQAFKVKGFGGGPDILCDADRVDFGPVSLGMSRSREITCTNVAEFDDPDTEEDRLRIFEPFIVDPTSDFRVSVEGGVRRDGYGVGDGFVVRIDYDAHLAGATGTTIRLQSNDTDHAHLDLAATGEGVQLPRCKYAVRPEPRLDFGDVEVGQSVELQAAVTNLGHADCMLQDVRASGNPAFHATAPELVVIPPGGAARLAVAYRPFARTSRALGELSFGVNGWDAPATLSLVAASTAPCLQLIPEEIDLGLVTPGCTTRTRTAEVVSACGTPLDVTAITVPEGQSTDGFSVARFDGPVTLERAGTGMSFDVAYRGELQGDETAVAFVQTAQREGPYVVVLRGTSDPDRARTASFVQQDPPSRCFTLDDRAVPEEIEVLLDGIPQQPTGEHGQEIWSLDESGTAVCFASLVMPEPGATVMVRYVVACGAGG